MKAFLKRLPLFIAIGALAVPLSVVTHELGHYLVYKLFGASEVELRAFSVLANKDSLTTGQIAISTIVGPVISYATVVIAAFMLKKRYAAFWVVLGLAAPFARLVNAIYVYFRIAGYDPNPNFDEFNFSRAIAIDPLIVAIPTTLAFIFIVGYFLRIAFRQGRYRELALSIVSVAFGLLFWTLVGPTLVG